jgi:hypothetical protein
VTAGDDCEFSLGCDQPIVRHVTDMTVILSMTPPFMSLPYGFIFGTNLLALLCLVTSLPVSCLPASMYSRDWVDNKLHKAFFLRETRSIIDAVPANLPIFS